ncbi:MULTISPECIES: beta strand repeat-containing protein [Chitinophagaceae]
MNRFFTILFLPESGRASISRKAHGLVLSCLLLFVSVSQGMAQAPTVTVVSPSIFNIGSLVTVTGTNLSAVTTVKVNGTAAVIVNKSATSLQFVAMPGSTSGSVSVTNSSGTATSTSVTVVTSTNAGFSPNTKVLGSPTSAAQQGSGVTLSADGNTMAVVGPIDNSNQGAIWVFVRNTTTNTWSQQAKLTGVLSNNPVQGLGTEGALALSADGNTLAAGDYWDGSSGGSNNNGAVWVFTRSGTAWNQQTKLAGNVGDAMGKCISLSADGNTMAVGANNYSSSSPASTHCGAVFVYARSGSTWSTTSTRKLINGATATGASSYSSIPAYYSFFGSSVSLSADGKTLAVGANNDGWNGTQGSSIGAVFIYTGSGTTWTQQGGKLVGSGYNAGSTVGVQQGYSVSLSADGNTLAEGGNIDYYGAGAVWIFSRSGTTWTQVGNKLSISSASRLGASVSLTADGTVLAAGANSEGSGSYGATAIFRNNSGTWGLVNTFTPSKPGSTPGTGELYAGSSVAVSADGSALAIGAPGGLGSNGATFVSSGIVMVFGGTVVDDANGLSDSKIGKSATVSNLIPSGLYVNLVDPSTNTVAVSAPVAAGYGSYSLTYSGPVPGGGTLSSPGTFNLVLTNSPTSTTAVVPPGVSSGAPQGWAWVGQTTDGFGAAANETTAGNGKLAVQYPVLALTIFNYFGINAIPSATAVAVNNMYPPMFNLTDITGYKGILSSDANAALLGGSDPDMGALTTGSSFQIQSISPTTKLFYSGTELVAGSIINNYDPSLLRMYGTNTSYGVSFTYSAIDIGGAVSPAATYSLVSLYALPVQYASPVKASLVAGGVQLQWTTGTETNNKGFAVQRSTDGSYFATLGFVDSKVAGGTGSGADYSFTDKMVAPGTCYYRLMQTDLDGNTTPSDIVSIYVSGNGSQGLSVYPNPAVGMTTVSGLQVRMPFSIMSMDGRVVRTWTATSTAQQIDVSGLTTGLYIVRTIANGTLLSVKFMVK